MSKNKARVISLFDDKQSSHTEFTYLNDSNALRGTEGQLAKNYELIETNFRETKNIKIVQDNNELIIEVPDGYKAKVSFELDNNATTGNFDIQENFFNKYNPLKEKNGNYANGTAYDIINKEMLAREAKNNYDNIEEVTAMRINNIFNKQIRFLLVAVAFIIFSLLGFIVFIETNEYIIHPFIYVATLIMGIGWGSTAICSIKHNKV